MPFDISANPILVYLLLGLLSGIFSAMFGVGGGIIMVPVLTILASLPQKEAQGISLCVMVPVALMGSIRYYMNPEIHIDFHIVLIMSVTVIIGANIGATVVGMVSNRTLQFGFAILLFLMGIRMMWSSWNGFE
ncbi:MAG TPA: sulfite exporter TauE/SafE family protein [bacterium]|nr:sulfite exporter TauE/SafE family protein [Candidatus Omnitrophota bacterium]HOJ61309.1 sulfite exporter TauE/SafE family protein [bacterium]HOL95689.1 sulfite exporter TauE/SafE family protein [bacterium]HPP02156.1 sulfite exporter TauE/SafE family protein [bacterium]